MVPYVFYNGGEVLLFSFEGWFLYGCTTLEKTTFKLLLFVLLSGWIGFFFKSSFVWIYAAGLFCLWIRLSSASAVIKVWLKKGLLIAIPAVVSLTCIYIFFLSKGQTPASASSGYNLTFQTFGFPLASPILSGFSVDDLLNGLIYHTGRAVLDSSWAMIILIASAIFSLLLIWLISKCALSENYKLFTLVFYFAALIFFGFSYLHHFTISMEARHFRIIGLLIVPGTIYFISRLNSLYQFFFVLICISIAFVNFSYLIRGYQANENLCAKGVTGIAQPNIDQPSLNSIIKLDKNNRNAVFVFTSADLGLEIANNRIVTLPPIGDDLKIDINDYRYNGHAGPLFIVLPESYSGPKEKMIMKSFSGYTGFNISMLSPKYVLYIAK